MSDVPDWVQTKVFPFRSKGAVMLTLALFRLGAPRFLAGERRVYLQISRPRLASEMQMTVGAVDDAVADLGRSGLLHIHGRARWDAARGLSFPVDPPKSGEYPPTISGHSSGSKLHPSQLRELPEIAPLRNDDDGSTDHQYPDQDVDPSVRRRVRAWESWAEENLCDNPEAFTRAFAVDVLEDETEKLQQDTKQYRNWWGILWARCIQATDRKRRAARDAEYAEIAATRGGR